VLEQNDFDASEAFIGAPLILLSLASKLSGFLIRSPPMFLCFASQFRGLLIRSPHCLN
jgi:hypothetical protein